MMAAIIKVPRPPPTSIPPPPPDPRRSSTLPLLPLVHFIIKSFAKNTKKIIYRVYFLSAKMKRFDKQKHNHQPDFVLYSSLAFRHRRF